MLPQIEEGLKISLVARYGSGIWEPLLGFNPVETKLNPREALLKYFVPISLQISLFLSFLSSSLRALIKWNK